MSECSYYNQFFNAEMSHLRSSGIYFLCFSSHCAGNRTVAAFILLHRARVNKYSRVTSAQVRDVRTEPQCVEVNELDPSPGEQASGRKWEKVDEGQRVVKFLTPTPHIAKQYHINDIERPFSWKQLGMM